MKLATLALSVCLAAGPSGVAGAAPALIPCFTPGEDCTGLIVQTINSARHELLVQAYGFTSYPIIHAIADAKARGVHVGVILDKTNDTSRYSGATYLENHGIHPLIDHRVAIAHNKVMVIDGRTVITGSFNFTKSAQTRNAENVLVIKDDPRLAKAYSENWHRREVVSAPYRGRWNALERHCAKKRPPDGGCQRPRRGYTASGLRG